MMDHATWRRELFDEIRTIADRKELEDLWFGKDSTAISSYEEEVAHVFDDYDIDGFIERSAAERWLVPTQLDALRNFRDTFANFVRDTRMKFGEKVDPHIILNDPKWAKVMSAAKDFITLIGQRPQ